MGIIFYTSREPVFKAKKSNHKKLFGVEKRFVPYQIRIIHFQKPSPFIICESITSI